MPETLSISFVAGYTFVAGEVVTIDKLNLLGRGTFTLLGSIGSATISDGAVTTAKLADGALSADTTGRAKMADGYLTAAKLNATQDWSGKTISGNPAVTWTGAVNFSGATFTPPAGYQVQQAQASTAAASVINAVIPLDDTIPQNSEGTELTAIATTITPKSATNVLEFECLVPYNLGSAATVIAALFQDSTANAIAAGWSGTAAAADNGFIILRHRMVAGTTSATTFKIRLGAAVAFTVNGSSGNRFLGGVMAARLTVKEIQV